jgi:hypothetical protein
MKQNKETEVNLSDLQHKPGPVLPREKNLQAVVTYR